MQKTRAPKPEILPARLAFACALLLAAAIAASAQPAPPPPESVTVTATKAREVIDKFVKSFAAPTAINAKIARWERGICPANVGQPAAFTAFLTARVKAIAAAVGAPVSELKSCTPNIEIVFTTTPQELLDRVRKEDPDYLGYAENSARRNQLATVTRPVQAWYLTETKDLDGMTKIDSAQRTPGAVRLGRLGDLPFVTTARITGNRINNGIQSSFNHITIIVDSKKLAGQNFVSLADYIALLALTQLASLDACQPLPSIVNLLAADCETRTDMLTANDLAYLRGLYRMRSDQSLVYQRNDIAGAMQQSLGGR